MKALVWAGPGQVELREVPIPEPQEGWALVRTLYGGICGSDITIRSGQHPRAKAPLVMGHEMAGEVVKINGCGLCGEGSRILPGQLVAVEPLLSCGLCPPCKSGNGHVCEKLRLLGVETDGGFADYFTAPLHRLYRTPEHTDLREAALAEPLAVAVHAVNTGNPRPGDCGVIIGAGPIGLLIGQVLRARGIGPFWISELDGRRRGLARELGFEVIDAKAENPVDKIRELTGGHGADLTFDAAGVPSVGPQLVPITAILGRIVMVALHKKPCEVFFRQLSYGEQSIRGVRIYAKGDFAEGLRLMASGAVDLRPLVSHTFDMADYEEAFAAASDSSRSCKVVLRFGGYPAGEENH
jgi:2-desacetyl-2-hydroxyethyl bacteriochlorophyllide A dehydrogenase